jgi:hypothetical protein
MFLFVPCLLVWNQGLACSRPARGDICVPRRPIISHESSYAGRDGCRGIGWFDTHLYAATSFTYIFPATLQALEAAVNRWFRLHQVTEPVSKLLAHFISSTSLGAVLLHHPTCVLCVIHMS